jgi:hypothetical protein
MMVVKVADIDEARSPTNKVMSTKELLLEEIESMSEVELVKALKILQAVGLTKHKSKKVDRNYPLRGLPVQYIAPTEPVAIADWDALQ